MAFGNNGRHGDRVTSLAAMELNKDIGIVWAHTMAGETALVLIRIQILALMEIVLVSIRARPTPLTTNII